MGKGDGSAPPLHPAAHIGTARIEEGAITTDPPRYATRGLEPFQLQRAEAFERALAALPGSMIEDVLKAAYYIESGRISVD